MLLDQLKISIAGICAFTSQAFVSNTRNVAGYGVPCATHITVDPIMSTDREVCSQACVESASGMPALTLLE